MLRRWLYRFLFSLAFVLTLWFLYPRLSLYWTLYQLHEAVQERDTDLFFTYANADSIANSFMEASSHFFYSPSKKDLKISHLFYQLFEKPAQNTIKNYMKECVQRGQITTPSSLMLLPYYYLFYDSLLVYHSHSIQGGWEKTAIVTIHLKDKKELKDIYYSIHLRFLRLNGRWIWVGFEDLEAFFEQMIQRKSLEGKPHA